jgi:hypothetical protein
MPYPVMTHTSRSVPGGRFQYGGQSRQRGGEILRYLNACVNRCKAGGVWRPAWIQGGR